MRVHLLVGVLAILGCLPPLREETTNEVSAVTPVASAPASAAVATKPEAATAPALPASVPLPPFPELPQSGGPCPPGMAFVPGGRWTAKQNKRFAKATTTMHAAWLVHNRADVEPFCLDITEFTLGDMTRCIATGKCTPEIAALPQSSIDESINEWWMKRVEQRRGIEAIIAQLLDGSDLIRWREAWATYAAHPYTLGPLRAIDVCAAIGRRLPSVEEWLWAAWGGTQDRRYPWGKAPLDPTRLNMNFDDPPEDHLYFEQVPAGSFPAGKGRWRHLDLFGNVDESVLMPPPPEPRRFFYSGTCGHDSSISDVDEDIVDRMRFPCSGPGTLEMSYIGFRCAASVRAEDTLSQPPASGGTPAPASRSQSPAGEERSGSKP